jgi:hypothetical protein
MANVTGSLPYTQSESRTRHECVHDGLVQFVLEACAQPPRTHSQDAQKWYKRRISYLRTRATHRRATAHRVRFKVLIHVLGTDWRSRRGDQQPHARAVLESIQRRQWLHQRMWYRVSYELASPGRRRCEELPCYWERLSPGDAEAWKEIVGCGRKAIRGCEYTAPSRWYSPPSVVVQVLLANKNPVL